MFCKWIEILGIPIWPVHDWSKWSEPKIVKVGGPYDDGSYYARHKQHRECSKCGKVVVRFFPYSDL